VAWVTGNRDIATFQRLYDKVNFLKDCTFYTDNWDAFEAVLPANRHVVGKAHTITIEQNNSNTRHYLGRMTRRTKIVSKTEEMVNVSMKLWCCIAEYNGWEFLRDTFSSIF
jgi:insertion element IS1 protein InsB